MPPFDDDPQDERIDAQRSSQYISKKDWKLFVLLIGLTAGLLTPIYFHLRENAYEAICRRQLMGLYQGMSLYAEANDGRFPPTYIEGDNQTPVLENGAAVSWTLPIEGLIKEDLDFNCPGAKEGEGVWVVSSTKKARKRLLTYGMYVPMSTEAVSGIDQPDKVALLAETANMGAGGSYDPVPFKLSSGETVPYDGFVVGFNTGGRMPEKNTQDVTRLAFETGSPPKWTEETQGRHREKVNIITASGRVRFMTAEQARYRRDDIINPLWAVPRAWMYRR
jgi:hypothetical protein